MMRRAVLQRIPLELNGVMRGLDPRIHLLAKRMDCRVKPGNDRTQSSLRRLRKLVCACALLRTTFTRAAVLALGVVFFLPPISDAINAAMDTVMSLAQHDIGLGFICPAQGQPAALTQSQAEALDKYNNALKDFRAVLSQRRAQINARQQVPNLPGQALYLARNNMISAYKDLTDVLPAKIGRPNKFAIPPAYFDADNEPLLDEYASVFSIMQAPPANAQNSATPFKDVVDLATAIARAKGLDPATAELAGRISLGLFFAETNGNQNIGNARSNTYKGSLQTGSSEDRNGQGKWAAIKKAIATFDPALIARDDKEEARVGSSDHRFNHWTAVRDGLMNAHAELFLRIPAIVKALPNAIDQMKLYELIQIIPTPTKAALNSGNLTGHRISDPTIMGYLRNNSIFTFGKADRARTSATLREILDAMWLFNDKFERALAKYNEIKAQQKG
jgi:hypothetical protein